jgi:hypothetical protein
MSARWVRRIVSMSQVCKLILASQHWVKLKYSSSNVHNSGDGTLKGTSYEFTYE